MNTFSIKRKLYNQGAKLFALFLLLGLGALPDSANAQVVFTADAYIYKVAGYKFEYYTWDSGSSDHVQSNASEVISGDASKNLEITLESNSILEVSTDTSDLSDNSAFDEQNRHIAQLYIEGGTGAVVRIDSLKIAATQGDESAKATAGISIGGNVILELKGDSQLYSPTSYAMNLAGNLTIRDYVAETADDGDIGSLKIVSDEQMGIRFYSANYSLTLDSGRLETKGTSGINRNNKLGVSVTVNGGYLTAEGTTGNAVAVSNFAINGGEVRLKSPLVVINGTFEGSSSSSSSSYGGGGGVLIYDGPLSTSGFESWNMLVISLAENQIDPYHSLYGSSTVVSNSATYFGRVYGEVTLQQDFTIEAGWLVDVPVGTKFRHGDGDMTDPSGASNTESYLTIATEGELRFKGLAYDTSKSPKDNAELAPVLWYDNLPAGAGTLSMVLSPEMIGGESYSGASSGILSGTQKLDDFRMEYDGGVVGYQLLTEAGFAGSSDVTALTAPVTFWNKSILSVQYRMIGATSGLGSSHNASAGTYRTLLQNMGDNKVPGSTTLKFKGIEVVESYFTVTPYDLTAHGKITGDVEMTVAALGAEKSYTLDPGGSLGTEFDNNNIDLKVKLGTNDEKTDLELNKDYELSYEVTATDGTSGTITKILLIAVGTGNYTGSFTYTTEIEVDQTLGTLGGESVVIDWTGNGGDGKVYVKPDGTIDLDTMQIKTVDGNLIGVGEDEAYSYQADEPEKVGDTLQYSITVYNKDKETNPNDTLTFTVTAHHAGTGTSFAQGQINLVDTVYTRPDGKIYAEDLILTDSEGALVLDTDYTIEHWDASVANDDQTTGAWVTATSQDVTGTTGTVRVKVTNKNDLTDSVEFKATWADGGTVVSNDFSVGSLSEYPDSAKIYVYYGTGIVLSIDGLGVQGRYYDSDGKATQAELTDADVELVSTFSDFTNSDNKTHISTVDSVTFLTLVSAGRYTGSITFEFPEDQIVYVDVSQNILGVLDDYVILTPTEADQKAIFQKPDGTLHPEDLLILEHLIPTLDSSKDPKQLQVQTLSTSAYSVSAELISGSTYKLTITSNSTGKTLTDTSTKNYEYPEIEFSPAGTGDTFRHGDISLVGTQTVDYVAPTGSGGEYLASDLEQVYSGLKLYRGSEQMTYGTDYSLVLHGDFGGIGTDTYTVTATDLKNTGEATTKSVTFDMQITMERKNEYSLTFNENEGTWVGEESLKTQTTTNDYELVNFPSNPTREGYNFMGWSKSTTGSVLTSETTTVASVTSKTADYVYHGTLYAIWEAILPNRVYFDYGFDGQGIWKDVEKGSDSDPIDFPGIPSRQGYDFGGWKQTDETLLVHEAVTDESGAVTTPVTTYDILTYTTVNENTNVAYVYAQWTEKTYTVHFDLGYTPQEGETAQTPSSLTRLNWLSTIPLPNEGELVRPGYTFSGWYYNNTKAEDGMTYSQLASSDSQESLTLTAKWTQNSTGGGGNTGGDTGGNTGGDTSGNTGGDTGGNTGGNTGGTGSSSGGSSSGGSSSGGSSSGGTAPEVPEEEGENTPPKTLTNPETGKNTVLLPVTTEDSQGTLTQEQMDQALAQGEADGGSFDLVIQCDQEYCEIVLDRETLQAFADSSGTTLTLQTEGVVLTFDQLAVRHILSQVSTYTVLAVSKPEHLSASALQDFGDRPFYDLAVLDGNGAAMENFGNGLVKVNLRYDLETSQTEGQILAGRVMDNGQSQYQLKSLYDGSYLQWLGDGLGIFGIVYRDLSGVLVDVQGIWSEPFLAFTDSRRLYALASSIRAEDKISREMYLAVLGILEGINPEDYAGTQVFSDVDVNSPFAPYVAWAYEKGITDGVGNNKFGPNQEITRQEIAVMLEDYIRNLGLELPAVTDSTDYSDQSSISGWAVDAVNFVQAAGLMEGLPGNSFLPVGISSYGEHAVSIMRLVECMLSINTVYLG